MRKSFRRAAFSWLRSLFKQSAREEQGAGVDGAALPECIETMTVEPKHEKGDRHGWLDLLRE
jgi:hypothetical protein